MSSYLSIRQKITCQEVASVNLPISKNDILFIQKKYLDVGDFYICGHIEDIYRIEMDDELDKINLLSYLIQNSNDYPALVAVCEHNNYDLDEWLSISYNAGDISFYYYEEDNPYYSKEERFGRTLAMLNGLFEKFSDLGGYIEDYFDFEKYGNDMSYDYTLTDDGYIYDDGDIDTRYDYEEILNNVDEDWIPTKDRFNISELSEFNHIELLEAMFEQK